MDFILDVLSLIYDEVEYVIGDLYIVTLGNDKKLYKATGNKIYNGVIDKIETKNLELHNFIIIITEDTELALESGDGYTTHIVYETGKEMVETGSFRYNFSANGLDIFIQRIYTGTYSEVLIIKQSDKSILLHCKVSGLGVMQNGESCLYLNQKGKNGGQTMVIIDKEYNIISLEEYTKQLALKRST